MEISGLETNDPDPQSITLDVWPMYAEDKKALGKI